MDILLQSPVAPNKCWYVSTFLTFHFEAVFSFSWLAPNFGGAPRWGFPPDYWVFMSVGGTDVFGMERQQQWSVPMVSHWSSAGATASAGEPSPDMRWFYHRGAWYSWGAGAARGLGVRHCCHCCDSYPASHPPLASPAILCCRIHRPAP